MKINFFDKGKIRDLYELDNKFLLLVTTDRISAYDHVLPQLIPGKGKVLTSLSCFWMKMMEDIVPNHLVETPTLTDVLGEFPEEPAYLTRSVVCKKLKPLKVECVVRGFVFGSAWKEYTEKGTICGIVPQLPITKEGQQLLFSIFTPSTKAPVGQHDVNITIDEFLDVCKESGVDGHKVMDISLKLYKRAYEHCYQRGIIVADTKLEFGTDEEGNLYLIDEVLTPDSSRFWSADGHASYMKNERTNIPSLDKQFVRDYLDLIGWDRKEPVPKLPDDIVEKTASKYREIEKLILGE